MGYVFTKCAIEGDDTGKLDKKLGDIPIELDESYKRLLLDETKLRVTTKKAAKPEEKKEGVAPTAVAAAGKKKKHKKKLPKNADPNNPPDPERWLPKWKRSKYRKKFGRKLRETQGEVTGSTQVGICTTFFRGTQIKNCQNRSSRTKHSHSRGYKG